MAGVTSRVAEGWRWRGRAGYLRRAQIIIVVAIGIGGSVGAVARFAIAEALPTSSGSFPWSTLLINLTGSAVLGFLLVILSEQFPRGHLARPVLGTGVIGAYTTFSTLEVESLLLLRQHDILTAVVYEGTSVVGGLVVAWVGVVTARLLLRLEHYLARELS